MLFHFVLETLLTKMRLKLQEKYYFTNIFKRFHFNIYALVNPQLAFTTGFEYVVHNAFVVLPLK